MKLKKIAIPFFDERHDFLLRKWWFRLLIVLYAIAFITIPFFLFSDYMSSYLGCYERVIWLYDYGSDIYKSEYASCQESVGEALPLAVSYAVIVILVAHYTVQLVFFKLIMNYIFLGDGTWKFKQKEL